MDTLFRRLLPLIHHILRRPLMVLVGALLLSALSFWFAGRLTIDTDFARLLPADYPSVQALERLKQTVGGESTVQVIIESPSFQANDRYAKAFISEALTLTGKNRTEPYITRIEYQKDPTFVQDNALYFASEAELDELETYLRDEIEQARLDANPFFFDLDDDFEDEEEESETLNLEKTYNQIVPKEYPISEDSTTLVLTLFPSGSKSKLNYVTDLYQDLRALTVSMTPASYHPEMQVFVGGRFEKQAIEIRAITRDVAGSFGGGVATVLLMVMLYFFYKAYQVRRRLSAADFLRMPIATLLIAIPLLMSMSWVFALAYFAYGTLNLMTSILILVLFGLGIDYGIHFYARYAEERAAGHTVETAIKETFISSGPPIATSALTTAVSLFVLMVADFQGFSQFGFIAGTGVLFAVLAMLFILPALLTLFEHWGLLRLEAETEKEAGTQSHLGWRFPMARPIVALSFVAVTLALLFSQNVAFEYNFGSLEPQFPEYLALRQKAGKVYPPSGKRNPAYVVVDEPAEIPAIVAAYQAKAVADTVSPTILSVESLQERYPLTAEAQQRRLTRLDTIRTLLNDTFLKASESEDLARLRRAAQTREPIPLDQVPAYLREKFTAKNGEVGNFVMIYPSVGLSDGQNSMAFAEDVGTIETEEGRAYYAGSTSIVAADMLRLMLEESPWMILFTTVVLFVLVGLVFRSMRWTILAVLPLIVGVLWMLGLMELFSIKLNFYNLIVLPAVLGIGNDTGIHLIYRYREEGRGSLWTVLRSTGEHITIGALTTMVGFAWWMFSYHPGLKSIGLLAVTGIGAVLLAALLFLPALLQWLEDRD